ncbi:MAG: hypothetical protein ABR591_01080 [Candidatus Velthaea sp.]
MEAPPKVRLNRAEWTRLVIAGIFVVFAVARVAPDAVRIFEPLGVFGYATDRNGIVTQVPRTGTKGSDVLKLGDRVRVDRIKPFDRKPGFIGRFTFTRENFDRQLPVDRDGKARIVHLRAEPEPLASRIITLVRILIFLISVALGAILYLVKPGVATFAFFIFSIGGDYPTTYADVLLENPWRQILQWIGDLVRGAARASLLMFAVCLLIEDTWRQRLLGFGTLALGLVLGTLHAYGFWLQTYGARPDGRIDALFMAGSYAIIAATAVAFAAAFLRAHGIDRQRTGWIVAAFAFAGIAKLASDQLFPAHLPLWFNSVLLSTSIVPIVTVWIAVIRHRFFEVDFVVSRGMVFVAIGAAVFGLIYVFDELGSYIFYNNYDLAYIFFMVFSTVLVAFTGKIKSFLDTFVDRFIFPDRRAQRKALEFIAGYILDAETVEDVHRALLQDAAHALKLTFSGIMTRRRDGSFELTDSFDWPEDMERRLPANDEVTRAITRSRSVLTFHGSHTHAIRQAFDNERLTFAAPIFADRTVSAIVVYGNNVSGLDLDPEERQLLVRVVAHASIALTMIELARYRAMAEAQPATPSPAPA